MKKFAAFSNEGILDGDKKKIDDIVNNEIIIRGYSIKDSKYSDNQNGEYLTLQFEIGEIKYVVFTGSKVLIDQIEKYKDEIPFLTTIRKINKYYSFT